MNWSLVSGIVGVLAYGYLAVFWLVKRHEATRAFRRVLCTSLAVCFALLSVFCLTGVWVDIGGIRLT